MLLYGPEWIDTAPLLTLVAVQSGLMICLPLVTELPILTGHTNRLIALNVVETLVSITLLAIGAHLAGAEGAAASRVVYALAFFLIYMRFISGVVQFRVRDWFAIMGKSALVSLATVAPILAAYAFWVAPAEMNFGQLLVCTVAGGIMWCLALFAVRHPALDDLLATGLPILRRALPRATAALRLRHTVIGDER